MPTVPLVYSPTRLRRSIANRPRFFLGRDADDQARACLCMYLRQAEPRIMAQVNYYAHRFSAATGQPTSGYELLDLIARSPDVVTQALPELGRVHAPQATDVFSAATRPPTIRSWHSRNIKGIKKHGHRIRTKDCFIRLKP